MVKRNEPKSAADDFHAMISEIAARRTAWYESIRHLPYDGIVGNLPAWVPEPIREDFERVRWKVFTLGWPRYRAPEDVRQELKAFCADAPLAVPLGYEDDFAALARWKAIVDQGKTKGLALLAGEDAARGEKFRHPRPPGALDDLGKLLKMIVASHPKISNAAAWAKLAALASPDHKVVEEVTEDTIWYRSRGTVRALTEKGFQARMTRIRRLLK